ncbi:MAG TPA: alcohol dehydrogenase catalytic domain-containing protein, partial [Thermodesulfobacteriota bacterium]|nr:alcohol dehydrogenase catalytic domain-containing protein [Thermodesulfobacteriota bacterium]
MPRDGYNLSDRQKAEKRAVSGSKAWRYTWFELKDIPVPDIKDDELLIRVGACGICGSDAHLYEMDDEGYILFSGAVKLPCIVGHEYSGEVVEAGRDVSDFKKGDIVTGESIFWCGKCLPCRYGMLNQCENIELMGLTSNGAFAEYIAVKAKYCWKLNGLDSVFGKDDIFSVGALIEPLGCAYNGIFISGGGFYPGANAVVYGAGPIGLAAVALLRAAGAGIIIAIDIIDERLELAKKLGADCTFNSDKTPWIEKVILDITQGWGADLQIEAAGAARHTI